jgi:hypoxanthine phosphoribosyltransferase
LNISIQWNEIRKAIAYIEGELEFLDFKPDVILGIANGGLVPAVMLHHAIRGKHTDVELLRIDKHRKIIKSLHVWDSSLKYLVIDDIFDTGTTHKIVEANLKNPKLDVKYSYLYGRRNSLPEDHYLIISNILDHDQWLNFPWERQQTSLF